ncbi:hypothetical protein WJM97_03645 [Okeanomitos corallinicola TIOX110]|uniref:DUF998 domain-containing protein n=1 Tax=Okeanomitos corallinicola TIOX110 TaxID=3133117 RepID=A0ABZ2UTR7_9CYAN
MQKLSIYSSAYTHQIKVAVLTFLMTLIPASMVFVVVSLTTNIDLRELTRDANAVFNISWYVGLFSNIGILIWSVCAATCLFSYAILKQLQATKRYSAYLLYAGLFTTLLLTDDCFLFHEVVFPKYFHIPEKLVLMVYLILALMLLINFRRLILQTTEYLILLFSLVCFASSIILDIDILRLNLPDLPSTIIEDTFKLIGITMWCTYFVRLCLQEVNNALMAKSARNEV